MHLKPMDFVAGKGKRQKMQLLLFQLFTKGKEINIQNDCNLYFPVKNLKST